MSLVQKYFVQLDDRPVFLAYNAAGRIGNADRDQAFLYDSYDQARWALERVRRERAWPRAKIFGSAVDTSDGSG